jgi:hypothetical protein
LKYIHKSEVNFLWVDNCFKHQNSSLYLYRYLMRPAHYWFNKNSSAFFKVNKQSNKHISSCVMAVAVVRREMIKKHAFSALFVQSDISVCNILPKLVNCYISNNNSCSYIEFPVIHGNSWTCLEYVSQVSQHIQSNIKVSKLFHWLFWLILFIFAQVHFDLILYYKMCLENPSQFFLCFKFLSW